MTAYLSEAAIFLAAAVLAVPLAKALGLGAIIGYLFAGVMIGPAVLGLIHDVEHVMHFAEFGVVLLLFVIGLELQPSRLWALRRSVFGLGGAQMLATAIPLILIGALLGLPWATAALIGASLALSSTAFALQTLAERQELNTRHGRSAFAILLFQDLSVIPLLAMIPLLAGGQEESFSWLAVGKPVAVIVAVIFLGRLLLRPALKLIAATRTQEVFTATALLLVVGTSLLMEAIGLSAALGAFLAGVLLADSEYSHALEADIEPFKGLLLGLFFISVGMGVNLALLWQSPLQIAAVVLGLMGIKFAVLYALGRWQGLETEAARRLGYVLAQGGEFAFVLFAVAQQVGLLPGETAELLIVAVSLSMALTPFSFMLGERIFGRKESSSAEEFDEMPNEHHPVVIAGFGRFGQMIGRLLRAMRIGFTALELDAGQVDFVRRFGNKTYFGDASREDLLRAAGVADARLFVLAVQDYDNSLAVAKTVRRAFPEVTIIARARNRQHAYALMELGIRHVVRDTFHSSVEAAGQVLDSLGFSDESVQRAKKRFIEHDEARLFSAFGKHADLQVMIEMAKSGAEELEQLFEEDAKSECERARVQS